MAQIIFELDKDCYYFPGELIKGHVTIVLNESTIIHVIKLKCEGVATTKWTENCAMDYLGEESEFKETVYLFESQLDEYTLEAGRYEYPFSFQLPFKGLPCSYRGDWGSIEYLLRATLISSGLFRSEIEQTQLFDIKEYLDLNTIDTVPRERPTEIKIQKNVYKILACKSYGLVSITFTLPKTAFVPWEPFCFQANIVNNTSETLKSVSVFIEKEIRYTGYYRGAYKLRKYSYIKVMEIFGPDVPPKEQKSWVIGKNEAEVCYTVPTMYSKLIKISYVAQINVELPSGTFLHGAIPIYIGTIPFHTEALSLLGPVETRKIDSQPFRGRKVMARRQYYVISTILLIIFTLVLVFLLTLILL